MSHPFRCSHRSTKEWDLLVIHEAILVAAIELKSQVGRSTADTCDSAGTAACTAIVTV